MRKPAPRLDKLKFVGKYGPRCMLNRPSGDQLQLRKNDDGTYGVYLFRKNDDYSKLFSHVVGPLEVQAFIIAFHKDEL